jgi:predicted ATPase/class 3 adenylate cyclase
VAAGSKGAKAEGKCAMTDLKAEGEVRKTVTFLFADIVDSSRLSLTLDAEALRNLLARYFGEMSSIIQRHGGAVDSYIGDAIMATFGVPTLHEDDALRAVRAAVEMRDTLAILNHALEADWNVQLAHRIGLNTGEVITGIDRQGHRFLTGEAVRVAKRLEEAASPNEILIGEQTYRLVRDAVSIQPSSPRTLKHGEKFSALTLINVIAQTAAIERRFEAPFIGRARQREIIDTHLRDVTDRGTCHLLTILGNAGVGKSRLFMEFADSGAGKAIVARGRCLPYGEGITYWPLADLIRDIARAKGLDAAEISILGIAQKLADDDKAELIAQRVSELLGIGEAKSGGTEQSFWAVRRLFEALARERPLVIAMDDLHLAEATFLDLIEHIVDFSRGSPILVVCMARPELLDIRPHWGEAKPNATTVVLDPLSEAECGQLVLNLLDNVPLSPMLQSRIISAAEGNPLFAEELVAMLVDEELLTRKESGWVARSELSDLPVPATINALLAARLEGLPAHERAILTTAAIEGAVFHRSTVAELGPSLDSMLDEGLRALVRRDLVRSGEADLSQGVYRFRHILIRDAAYRSLSKNVRADLHERFAVLLETKAMGQSRDFEEMAGYHLEQAFQYRVALGFRDTRVASLALRAAARLEAAARRALGRSHLSAGTALLQRVCALLPAEDSRRRILLPELGSALIECGKLAEAERALGEAESLAATANDERAASHVIVQQQLLRLLRAEDGGTEQAAQAIAQVITVFNHRKDDIGLCRARRLEAWLCWNEARAEAAAKAWESAAMHARLAGDRHQYSDILTWIASSLWCGPTPASDAIRRCELMREDVRDSPEAEAAILRHLGSLYAMIGNFDLARRLLGKSNAAYAELGLTLNAATSQSEAIVELLAGNAVAAEDSLRKGFQALEQMGERAFLSTTAAFLARSVLEQGRDDEADELTGLSGRLAAKGDLLTQILWRSTRARVLSRRGQLNEAQALARVAVALAQATDFVTYRADALLDLAHVLKAASHTQAAVKSAAEALDLYEVKGNIVSASATRSWLGNNS